MKSTIANIVNSANALSQLLEQKLPLAISLQLGKVSKEVEPIYQKAEEARMEALTRYGTPDANKPGYYNVPVENQAAYIQSLKEIFEQEIELILPTIPISKLPEACLSARDVIALSWLLTEDAEPTNL